jgi:hypothetical protein
MAIDREKRKRILQRVATGALVILIAVGARVLVLYEYARMRDAQTLARIGEMQSVIAAYAFAHGVYPSMGGSVRVLGTSEADCLSSDGFVSAASDACRARSFGFFGPLPGKDEYQVATYASREADGETPCANKNGCPQYSIQFLLQTNRIARSGLHSVTPRGIK